MSEGRHPSVACAHLTESSERDKQLFTIHNMMFHIKGFVLLITVCANFTINSRIYAWMSNLVLEMRWQSWSGECFLSFFSFLCNISPKKKLIFPSGHKPPRSALTLLTPKQAGIAEPHTVYNGIVLFSQLSY